MYFYVLPISYVINKCVWYEFLIQRIFVFHIYHLNIYQNNFDPLTGLSNTHRASNSLCFWYGRQFIFLSICLSFCQRCFVIQRKFCCLLLSRVNCQGWQLIIQSFSASGEQTLKKNIPCATFPRDNKPSTRSNSSF